MCSFVESTKFIFEIKNTYEFLKKFQIKSLYRKIDHGLTLHELLNSYWILILKFNAHYNKNVYLESGLWTNEVFSIKVDEVPIIIDPPSPYIYIRGRMCVCVRVSARTCESVFFIFNGYIICSSFSKFSIVGNL